uniref:Uncharacterized protein n=1 Tax=Anguilla anguilla TaxID=7936 RepID=A0A0E9UXC5_ANGAN
MVLWLRDSDLTAPYSYLSLDTTPLDLMSFSHICILIPKILCFLPICTVS